MTGSAASGKRRRWPETVEERRERKKEEARVRRERLTEETLAKSREECERNPFICIVGDKRQDDRVNNSAGESSSRQNASWPSHFRGAKTAFSAHSIQLPPRPPPQQQQAWRRPGREVSTSSESVDAVELSPEIRTSPVRQLRISRHNYRDTSLDEPSDGPMDDIVDEPGGLYSVSGDEREPRRHGRHHQSCVQEFDQSSEKERYPGISVHYSCIFCSSTVNQASQWPYVAEYQPDLGGIRVLSLDGGGVRGVIPLTLLLRLEEFLGRNAQIRHFFDLMVGTSAGGIIALGLGVHNFTVSQCIRHFKHLTQKGLDKNAFTTTYIIGWFRRYWGVPIYDTKPLEKTLRDIFGQRSLFGHDGNATRVAVTTTVENEARLLANYDRGGRGNYLNSSLYTWYAARCTSAAPMYFEHAFFNGSDCWDGGLLENNPVQLAVNQAKTIWGDDVYFDIILSLGCGWANNHQGSPWEWGYLPEWICDIFKTFLQTMDGRLQWDAYLRNVSIKLRQRSHRLNVSFDKKPQPALDDVARVPEMERLAESQPFPFDHADPGIKEHFSRDAIAVYADRLFGSLYFFEMTSLTKQEDVSIIHEWICCRHPPQGETYKTLMNRTICFFINGKKEQFNNRPQEGERLKLPVSFTEQDGDRSIRIDVQFDIDVKVAISGFPTTLSGLKKYWESR